MALSPSRQTAGHWDDWRNGRGRVRGHQAKTNIGIRPLCLPTAATRKHFYATGDLPAKAGIYCQLHKEQMNIQGWLPRKMEIVDNRLTVFSYSPINWITSLKVKSAPKLGIGTCDLELYALKSRIIKIVFCIHCTCNLNSFLVRTFILNT